MYEITIHYSTVLCSLYVCIYVCMYVCRRVYLRLSQDSIDLFPALNHPASPLLSQAHPQPTYTHAYSHTLFRRYITHKHTNIHTYIHRYILHTRFSDKNEVKNIVLMICMHVCIFLCSMNTWVSIYLILGSIQRSGRNYNYYIHTLR